MSGPDAAETASSAALPNEMAEKHRRLEDPPNVARRQVRRRERHRRNGSAPDATTVAFDYLERTPSLYSGVPGLSVYVTPKRTGRLMEVLASAAWLTAVLGR